MSTGPRQLLVGVCALAGLGVAAPRPATAQGSTPQVFFACYVRGAGIVYRIKEAGLPQRCHAPAHVEFSWTDAAGGVTDHGALSGLGDDDHAQYLLTNGVRAATNGFAVTGTIGTGTIPAMGVGVRLMWYAGKAAFRAGDVNGSQWDDANVGFASTALGRFTTASGLASTALGISTRALGDGSAALGNFTTASGFGSTALGDGTTASGPSSTALGSSTTASGLGSTALGLGTTASGPSSTALGNSTTASAGGSTALGNGTTASGTVSTALGNGTTASGPSSTALGDHTTASGFSSTALGRETTASGGGSTATGSFASTNGFSGSFVYGDGSTSALVSASAPNQFVVRAAGGTIFYSNAALSAGVQLSPGAGAWASVSDEKKKEHFADEDGERALERIAGLPVRSWNYTAQGPGIRHLGPTAQDFYAAFALGESDTTISTVDADGVALLAVQALERRTREQAGEIEALRAESAALRAELAALRVEIAQGAGLVGGVARQTVRSAP